MTTACDEQNVTYASAPAVPIPVLPPSPTVPSATSNGTSTVTPVCTAKAGLAIPTSQQSATEGNNSSTPLPYGSVPGASPTALAQPKVVKAVSRKQLQVGQVGTDSAIQRSGSLGTFHLKLGTISQRTNRIMLNPPVSPRTELHRQLQRLSPIAQSSFSNEASRLNPLRTAEAGTATLTARSASDRDDSSEPPPSSSVLVASPRAIAPPKLAKAVGQKQFQAHQVETESPRAHSGFQDHHDLILGTSSPPSRIGYTPSASGGLEGPMSHQQSRASEAGYRRMVPRLDCRVPATSDGMHSAPSQATLTQPMQLSSSVKSLSHSKSLPGRTSCVEYWTTTPAPMAVKYAWRASPHPDPKKATRLRLIQTYHAPLSSRSRLSGPRSSAPSRLSSPPLTARSERKHSTVADDIAGAATPQSLGPLTASPRLLYGSPCNSPRDGRVPGSRSHSPLDQLRSSTGPFSSAAVAASAGHPRSSRCAVTEGNASVTAPPVNHSNVPGFTGNSSPGTTVPAPLGPRMGSPADGCDRTTYHYHCAFSPPANVEHQPMSRENPLQANVEQRYIPTPAMTGKGSFMQRVSWNAGLPPAPSQLKSKESDACISRHTSCNASVSRQTSQTALTCHDGTISSSGVRTIPPPLQNLHRSSLGEDRGNQARVPSVVTPRPSEQKDFSVPSQVEAASETVLKGEYARFSGVGGNRVLMFHIGTVNWQRPGESDPGVDPLHVSMHETFNTMPGVKCYSLYPSWSQTNPDSSEEDTFRVLNLDNDHPMDKAGGSSLFDFWHSMSAEAFGACCKRIEDEVCAYMDEIKAREGKSFDFLISHAAFVSALAATKVVQRCRKDGQPRLRHFSFLNGSAIQMYIKERQEHHSHPVRFLEFCRDKGLFAGDSATAGVWLRSPDIRAKFLKCFPSFPEGKIVFSQATVDLKMFFPRATTVARDLAEHIRDTDRGSRLHAVKRLVTFVGKFPDWNRDRAVLHGVAIYEQMFPDLGTVVVSSGLPGDAGEYETLAKKLRLQRVFIIHAQKQEALAELFSMSEVGISTSYWQPFSKVFIECMACGTPAISAGSGTSAKPIVPDLGTLLQEEGEWRTERGVRRLGERFAAAVARALREDWKGKSKGRRCVSFVKAHFSMLSQCQGMLDNMVGWARPKLICQIGANDWHQRGDFASGGGSLHESTHRIFNSMPGVKCYSIHPSCNQTDPDLGQDGTFRAVKLRLAISTWEAVRPLSSCSWHSMSDQEFAAYQRCLEEEVCAFMDEAESKEGKRFDFVISHHAFVNAMAGVQIVEQRRRKGNPGLRHFNFVHGMEIDMYTKEQHSRDPAYPMRFLKMCRDQRVFSAGDLTAGVWASSSDCSAKFSDCFPFYPKSQIALSGISADQSVFYPKGTRIAKDLANYLEATDGLHRVMKVRRIVTFVGAFVEWKRLDAVLYAAAEYERTFPDLGTVILGNGTPETVDRYKGLANSLRLERAFFLGARGPEVAADLLSMSEVGVFPSHEDPFGIVFVECMACGTPTIGAASGAPRQFVTPSVGQLVDEEAEWRSAGGIRRLGKRLAEAVTQALHEDWKRKSKGPNCVPFVEANFSRASQCQAMVSSMMKWAGAPPPPRAHSRRPPLPC